MAKMIGGPEYKPDADEKPAEKKSTPSDRQTLAEKKAVKEFWAAKEAGDPIAGVTALKAFLRACGAYPTDD